MTRARVLVVEDEGVVAMALEKCLSGIGHRVVGNAATGEAAIREARELEPDLVLMDIRLKGRMDGIEAAQKIHGDMKIPVIYMTAYSDEKTLERARETEPFGYLLKPVNENAVRSAIEIALHNATVHAGVREARDRYSRILEGMPDGLVAADARGMVTFVNTTAERLLGVSSGDLLGKTVGDVFRLTDEKDGAVTISAARTLFDKAETVLTGLMLERVGADRAHVDIHVAPLLDSGGRATGMAISIRSHARPD